MLDEGSCAMEKKIQSSARQSPIVCRNGGGPSERKSDFTPTRHSSGRRSVSNGSTKTADASQLPRPVPIPKWDRSGGDRRSRQRNCYDNRKREEIVEQTDESFDLYTGSRKGNANHLLNIRFHTQRVQHEELRWHSRNHFIPRGRGGYKKALRYKKEQFLQASCQFVVRDTGDYTEQAINPDALVDWCMIELVRSFSTEPVKCPICLQTPIAGKITKCGHTYCWACILHYIKLGEEDSRKCPICYDTVELGEIKSVQWVDVPEFNIGDEIEMRLMKKMKGSNFALPRHQWEDRLGKTMNVEEGDNTKYMKLLVASIDQIQRDVIDLERTALTVQLEDAEESEVCFIHMALDYLQARESSLSEVFQQTSVVKDQVYIPGLGLTHTSKTQEKDFIEEQLGQKDAENKPNMTRTTYADAFEEKIDISSLNNDADAGSESVSKIDKMVEPAVKETTGSSSRQRNDSEDSLPFGSPPCPYPLLPDQEVTNLPLDIEETAEHLELPMDVPQPGKVQSRKADAFNTKDEYFFYQASTGQHIYLNSLNAQCLAKEYGSLEESPDTIKATVVAIERIFMTEDVRKRLRYLGHIPLTCEFHVVELKIKPPVVSKETLKFFEASFEKRRKLRQQKAKEEKKRAKKYEIDHRKSFGLYPEVQIPLDNLKQFPSYMASSVEEEGNDGFFPSIHSSSSDSSQDVQTDENDTHPERFRHDSASDESLNGSMSFAQMLKAEKTSSHVGGAWGRPAPRATVAPSLVEAVSGKWSRPRCGDDDSDGEGLPAPSYSATMSDAIARALDDINMGHGQSMENSAKNGSKQGGGKKKRKEKKILFSTGMARKN